MDAWIIPTAIAETSGQVMVIIPAAPAILAVKAPAILATLVIRAVVATHLIPVAQGLRPAHIIIRATGAIRQFLFSWWKPTPNRV